MDGANERRIAFWNVAGLGSNAVGFWMELEKWDVMILSETWIEGKDWEKVKYKIQKGYGRRNGQRKHKRKKELRGVCR